MLCVPALPSPPPKSNGCSLQKSHLYKENIRDAELHNISFFILFLKQLFIKLLIYMLNLMFYDIYDIHVGISCFSE